MNQESTHSTNQVPKSGIPPIAIIGIMFFIFGFITWMNSVLIPYLKIACELNNFESYLVAFAFYIAYLVMGVPCSMVLKATGFKKGMSFGLVVIAIGAVIFIPAAMTRTYSLFLFGLFVQGTGLALLQTASNPYITILGPLESAAKRISIMGICNKVAGGIAPIVLGAIALKDADALTEKLHTLTEAVKNQELNALASRVIMPYAVIVIILLALATWVYFSTLPEIDTDKEDDAVATANAGKTSVFQFPHLILGVATVFLYVGVEVLAGDSIISYAISQDISLSTAKFFTTCTLFFMIAGYIIGILCIPKYFSQDKALVVSAISGIVFGLAAIYTTGFTSVLFIAFLGFSNSLMWPAIWPLALAGLGRFTKVGSSLMIMGIAGGAVIPLIYGGLVDQFGDQQSYWIVVPCYAFILFYATIGHKFRRKA